jgi:hypothetical protein
LLSFSWISPETSSVHPHAIHRAWGRATACRTNTT